MADNISGLATGWVVAKKVEVTPSDAQPGDTIHIRAIFENENWIPAYAVLQVKLDGAVIKTWCDYVGCFIVFGSNEVFPWEFDYTLPTSISPGISHRIEALEQDQIIPASTEFTVTSPAQPGQRNVSFSSVPEGAQIYIADAYYGNTPITVPLVAGVHAIKAVYSGQEQSRNIQVVSGTGTMSVTFTFSQTAPFDFGQWLSDNKWTVGGALISAGVLYLIVKKPATVKRGLATASELAGKGYMKAREAYQKTVMKD